MERHLKAATTPSSSTALNGLSLSEYSDLIEILASAMKDATRPTTTLSKSLPSLSSFDPRLSRSLESGLDSWGSIPTELSSLLGDELKYRNAMPSYPSWVPGAGSSNWDIGALCAPGTDGPEAQGSAKLNLINKLPSETLTRILSIARLGCEVPESERHPSPGAISSTRNSHMKWILSLSLVCKAWKPAVMSSAYSNTVIRSRQQMAQLSVMLQEDAELASYILAVDIRVPAFVANSASSPSSNHPYSRHNRARARAFPWLRTPADSPLLAPAPAESPDDQLLCTFITRCSSLTKLELHISKSPHFHYGGWSVPSSFLERGCVGDSALRISLIRKTPSQSSASHLHSIKSQRADTEANHRLGRTGRHFAWLSSTRSHQSRSRHRQPGRSRRSTGASAQLPFEELL
jgi:hypothetical protein